MNNLKDLLLIAIVFCTSISFSQEKAQKKTFEYSIGIDRLKTQEQADKIITKIEQIRGVKNCSLILINYQLIFKCTNHDLHDNGIIDVVKQIITEEGSDITFINRKTITKNEESN